MPEKPCIIITRPLEDASSTAQLLSEKGFNYFIEPVLHTEIIPSAQNELKNNLSKYSGLIVTSRNAVRSLPNINQDIKIITLGKSTTNFVKELGFRNVEYAGINIKELCRYIKLNYSDRSLAYASGEDISCELNKENCGNTIDRFPIYKTIPSANLSDEFRRRIQLGEFSGIVFFSKKTAAIFYKILQNEGLELYTKNISAFCLSNDIAEFIKSYGFKATIHTKNPNIEEIIQLVVRFRF